jgi:hypothetical protein
MRAILLLALALLVSTPQLGAAAERDLSLGLGYLRAGSQIEAERHLTRYRDTERDPEIRTTLDRMLPLLKRPLPEEVREYMARTIEDSVRAKPRTVSEIGRRSYLSRMFPVFP